MVGHFAKAATVAVGTRNGKSEELGEVFAVGSSASHKVLRCDSCHETQCHIGEDMLESGNVENGW